MRSTALHSSILTLMRTRIRILFLTVMRVWILLLIFKRIWIQLLTLNRIRILWLDADLDLRLTLMRILIWLFTLMRVRIQFPEMMRIHENPDPPQQFTVVSKVTRVLNINSSCAADYKEQLDSLTRENFSLKLRIYYMEERIGRRTI